MTDSPNPFALDADIAAMCDAAQVWLCQAFFFAGSLGASVADYLGSLLPARLLTGYGPKSQRNDVAHRAYSDGLRTPSRKPDRWDRLAFENAKWVS